MHPISEPNKMVDENSITYMHFQRIKSEANLKIPFHYLNNFHTQLRNSQLRSIKN